MSEAMIEMLKNKVEYIEKEIGKLRDRIAEIEKNNAVTSERIETIIIMITKLETSVDKISQKLEKSNERPVTLLWSVLTAVITAIVVYYFKK